MNKDDQCIDNEIAQIYQIVREKSIPITFVKGENNILADALSRKELSKGIIKEQSDIEIALRELLDLPFKVVIGKYSNTKNED